MSGEQVSKAVLSQAEGLGAASQEQPLSRRPEGTSRPAPASPRTRPTRHVTTGRAAVQGRPWPKVGSPLLGSEPQALCAQEPDSFLLLTSASVQRNTPPRPPARPQLTFQKRVLQCRQKSSVSPYCSRGG